MKLTSEMHNYDIFPKVVRHDKPTEITIKPLGLHVEFTEPEYILGIRPMTEGSNRDYPSRPNNVTLKVKPCEDGCLRFTYAFSGEQEYYIRIFKTSNTEDEIAQLCLYSLLDDLCDRYPLAGDLHMHTCRSDGKQSPAVVAANYRRFGYDFLAITDHGRYYPSLEAMDAFKDVPHEFNLIPGEEVHMPDLNDPYLNDVHIVNFGGEFSINGLWSSSSQFNERGAEASKRSINPDICPEVMTKEEAWEEIKKLAEELSVPEGVEKYTYASCKWIFDRIKEAKGLGIFAHPYWISDVYQVPETFVEYMMEQQPFDAFEVLGGEVYYEQNGFQTQRYYEDRAKDRDYPIVGSTDSHGSFNNPGGFVCHTIVFAPENERVAIIDSIKDKYSVAVDTISKEFRLVGSLRLSRYACFLLRNYFPIHDDLCFEDGRAMKAYACGDEDAEKVLRAIYGRIQKLYDKYFSF